MSRTYRAVCDILYNLDGVTGYNANWEIYEYPTIDDFETYAHYQNCGCEQISREDIPIIFRCYFYFTNQYDNLELVCSVLHTAAILDMQQMQQAARLSSQLAECRTTSYIIVDRYL